MRPVLFAFVLAAACGSPATPPPAAPTNRATTAAPPPAIAGFEAVAATRGFAYTAPPGFAPVAIAPNDDVAYDHAIASADGRVELRFALRDYQPDLPEALRTAQFSSTFFQTAIMNITQDGATGDTVDDDRLDPADFAADQAHILMIRWLTLDARAGAFGKGFGYCAVVFMHRDGFGDAYTFVMMRDGTGIELLNEAAVHALRFAPR